MSALDDLPRVHAETRAEWRAWLQAHAATERGVWLVSWRRHTGRPAVGYDDSVREALAFGWVDSKGNSLDADRTMLYFCPRKPGSGWSRPNKLRIQQLEAEGLMTPAGRRVIDAAIADGSWTLLDDVEDLIVPADLADGLAALPGAREQWDGFPKSARRALLEWLVHAKRAETRAARIAEIARKAARGERANQWAPKPRPADDGA